MASSVAPDVSLLLSREFQRYQNSAAVQIGIPFALSKVLEKACVRKDDEETYLQFLNNKLGITEEDLGKKYGVYKNGKQQLQKDIDARNFDPTLLYSLIKATIDKLNTRTREIDMLKTDLDTIIQTRNAFCHSNDERGNDPSIFQRLQKSLPRIIRTSGVVYCQSLEATKQELIDLEHLFRFMRRSERADIINANTTYYCKVGMEDIIDYWKKYRSWQIVPFINKVIPKNVYFPLKLITETWRTEENESMLLKHSNKNGVTILKGEAGAGKSTIVTNLTRRYLGLTESSEETAEKLNNFDMIHFIDCRDNTTFDLSEYFRKNFPKTFNALGDQNMRDCFVNMKNLVIVDGYDEINDISAKLLNNFLAILKSSTQLYHCIITTRPHASNELRRLLTENGITFHSYLIADITNKHDQMTFLKKYEESGLPIQDLTMVFDELPLCIKSYFTSVVLLTWFVVQCIENKAQVQSWTKVSDVTNDIFTYYTHLIERKLSHIGIKNKRLFLGELLNVVTIYGLQCLANNKISITEEEKQQLEERCLPVVEHFVEPNQVDISHVLSSLYVTRTLQNRSTVFEFYHKTHLEIFGAKALLNRLNRGLNETVSAALRHLIGPEGYGLDR